MDNKDKKQKKLNNNVRKILKNLIISKQKLVSIKDL